MITDIFELFSAAGLPDPRRDAEFRRYLLEQLQAIEGGLKNEDGVEKAYEELTIPEKARFLQHAQKQVDNGPASAERNNYMNKLIDAYQANVDLKKVLELTPKEIDNLSQLPERV